MRKFHLSIKSRIYLMCFAIVSLLVLALAYVTFEVRKTATLISSQRSSVEMLQTVQKVRVQFLTLQYWYNEFALSWQMSSKDRAVNEKKLLDEDLKSLGHLDDGFAKQLSEEINKFEKKNKCSG